MNYESLPQLYQRYQKLSPAQQKQVHTQACHFALSVWLNFCQQGQNLSYVDTVVGMEHQVEQDLPARALAMLQQTSSAQGYQAERQAIALAYREPICALQDMDWELPESVLYAYYAIYNCFRKYAAQQTLDGNLILNQALAAEADSEQWPQHLQKFLIAIKPESP